MATSGQTLNDRINAARYALAGQGLARCVCKATTEEVIGPKKKHLDYLLACTHEPNVSIPQLANLLIERTNHIQWVVVFKALVTVHHLMSYGNERFIQYLASSNYSFELSTFLDKTSARDFSMSAFIRRYSRYINEKALSYRLLAFDFCKIKRGNEGVLRLMPIDRLLKTLPILQNQLDALLEFDCSAGDLNNGVINACFMLLFRDLIGLFACHNDGIINLLNKYFTLNKKMCREAFDLYKKFLVRMDKVSDFLRVAEVVGIDKDEIPDLRRAPSSLIDALEQHLQNLETSKKVPKQSSSGSGSNSNSNRTGGDYNPVTLGNVTPTSSSSTNRSTSPSILAQAALKSGPTNAADELSLSNFKDDEIRKALEEEARVLSLYGTNDSHKSKSSPGQLRINSSSRQQDDSSLKFAVSTAPKTIDDIFGDSDTFAANNNNTVSQNNKSENKGGANGLSSMFDGALDGANTQKTSHAKPDLESIKSAIQSATTTLEKVSGSNYKGSSDNRQGVPKKASDDLFSLLDTSTTTTPPSMRGSSKEPSSLVESVDTPNPLSPFSTSASPFDLPTNGGSDTFQSVMKSGNPFPDVTPVFSSAFPTSSNQPISSNLSSTQITAISNPIFKQGAQQSTGPNYTSLGGLEGFGDVLQPTSATGKITQIGATGGGQAAGGKMSFTNSSGLSSTGLFKGDLDSTLANLAQNLTFEGISKPRK